MANLSNINNKFLVTTTGEVLIGGTAAIGAAKLQVTGEARVYTGSNLGYWGVDAGNSYVYLGTNSSGYGLSLQTAGTERMRIDSSGNSTFSGKVFIPQLAGAIQGTNYPGTTYVGSGTDATATYIQAGSTSGYKQEIKLVGGNSGYTSFLTQSVERMRIRSDGSILQEGPTGGGTNTFQTWQYGNDTNYRLDLKQNVGGGIVKHIFDVVNNSTSYSNMLVLDRGNVGIGTISPQKNLQIFQAEGGVGVKHATIRLGGYSTVGPDIAAYRVTGNSNDQGLIFSTYDATAGTVDTMTLTNDGNVGIGTTSPTSPTSVTTFLAIEGTTAGIVLSDNGNAAYKWDIWNSGGGLFMKYNDTTFGVCQLSNGKVGIGTTSPSATLDVQGSSALFMTRTSSGLATYIENDGGYAAQYMYQIGAGARIALHTNGNSYFNGGNVGIGITNPQDKLHVDGDAIISSNRYGNYAVGGLDTTGVVVATITGSGNGASASIEFVGMGGVNGIVDVVYNCTNQGGNWYVYKNERQTARTVDVVATGNGTTTLTFTFKAISSSQGYTPRIRMIGSPYNLITF